MIAFALSLTMFSFWWVLGWSMLSVLGSRRNLVRNALVAPALGVAALTLLVFEIYRLGVPVRVGGPVATVIALAAAAVLLWRVRTPLPVRVFLPFLGVLLAAAILSGHPMLRYGFDWVSYCTDDMANYVLLARAMLTRGYLSAINPADIVGGRDPGVILWAMFGLQGVRCGSEVVLAWVMSCARTNVQGTFMPTILALHMVLISAGGALVCAARRYRTAALVTCGWLALSSLMTLGAVYQRIAQVFGLGLLAAAAALLFSRNPAAGPGSSLRRALAGGILVAALGVSYPEVFPFLALAFCLYHAVAIVRRKENWKSLARFSALLAGLAIVLLNTYAGSVVSFLRAQVAAGSAPGVVSNVLFPYYLIPSGLAAFWGLQPIAGLTPHPLIDVYIVLGGCLLAAGAAASLWMAWRGHPAGVVSTVMLAVAARLFVTNSDFGLYKLAMFIQPFLLGAMTVAWFSLRCCGAGRPRWTTLKAAAFCAPLALIAASGIPVQQAYVRASIAPASVSAGLVEIPDATTGRIVAQLEALAAKPRRAIVVSDSANVMLTKFESPYLTPSSQWYPAREIYSVGDGRFSEVVANWYADLVRPGYTAAVASLFHERSTRFTRTSFDMHGSAANGFSLESNPHSPGFPVLYSLIASGPRQAIMNRSSEPVGSEGRMIRLVPSEQVRNHLVLIDSDLGKNYFLAHEARFAGRVAMFQIEPDYFFRGESTASVGRVLLFQVLNPSQNVRVVMDYTASLKSDGRNVIPPAAVIGVERTAFGAIGRGSARLISPAIAPQMIQGRYYVSIDMGADGQRFPDKRVGLMRAYGLHIPMDSRAITGFARDISAIDEDRFDALRPPSMVSHFPADLRNTGLEYSGVYEDGWVAESSFFRLMQPPRTSVLRIRAMVPPLTPPPSALRVVVGGLSVAEVALRPGDNDVKIPLAGASMVQRVELHFDRAARLPGSDKRPASALLGFVGFEETGGERQEIADLPVTIGDRWYPFEKFGGHTFRWVDNDAQFRVHSIGSEKGKLGIEVESGPGFASKPFRLELRGEGGRSWVLAAHGGREVLPVPVVLHGGDNGFSLHVSGGGLPTPNDPRNLNFRVFSITWTPQH